jgi:hypothetical protein
MVASRRLIVAIDADASSVNARMMELEDRLTKSGIARREAAERICILVPRRNVETWIHHFHGHSVDETSDYKALYGGDAKGPACKKAGEDFEVWLRGGAAAPATASLDASRAEAKRV